jgi:EVE domain
MYSPRSRHPDGEPLQHFTAIGTISTGEVYQVELTQDFRPYRIDVQFFEASEAPIRPLIESLSFIKNKTHWGAAFRFGYIKVPQDDFELIAESMAVRREEMTSGQKG